MTVDISTILLLVSKGETSFQQILLILLTPILTNFLEKMKNYFIEFYDNYNHKETNSLEFISEQMNNTMITRFYPVLFRAISYYAKKNNVNNSKMVNSETGIGSEKEYVMAPCTNFDLKNGIFIDIIKTESLGPKDSYLIFTKLYLKSKEKTVEELKKFVDDITNEYENTIKKADEKKLRHFIYKGKTGTTLNFSDTIISDFHDDKNKNFETFDHIFNEHKDKLISDLNRLNDVDYYKRHGIKRKKGYLFYGYPGCGKTYSVMAMANKAERHILEVPMSRVKTNEELEEIINLKSLNNFMIKKDQLIILFDEIDCGNNAIIKREDTKDASNLELVFSKLMSKDIEVENDKLSLGTVLSRLDGIGSYNGIIFIATTNCKESLDPALYRHGRLDPYFFTYLRKIDIINIIEKSYDISLNEEQKLMLPDRENKLSPSSLKKYIQDYEDNLDELLDFIKIESS